MLYIAAYAFLLRVRSESLPIRIAGDGEDPNGQVPAGQHSSLMATKDAIVLKLERRKNRVHGSKLTRGCWCSTCKVTCPLHCLGPWLLQMTAGHRPFGRMTGARATSQLRRRLALLHVPEADKFNLHGFRRGHAQDLLASGADLYTILRAGEWRSSAFVEYLEQAELESAAVMEAHLQVSSDDGDED